MEKAALLILDMQQGVVGRFNPSADFLSRFSQTVKAARDADVQIVYVTLSFRPGYPEASRHNTKFTPKLPPGAFTEGDATSEIQPDIAPTEKDIVVVKRRISAFSGNDLDLVLSSLEIKNVVLAGIATGNVVFSTLRQAFDLDYAVTVLDDLCLDQNPEVHQVLIEKVFPRHAHVMSSQEWLGKL